MRYHRAWLCLLLLSGCGQDTTIRIANYGDQTQDLTGWSLQSTPAALTQAPDADIRHLPVDAVRLNCRG